MKTIFEIFFYSIESKIFCSETTLTYRVVHCILRDGKIITQACRNRKD